jgi:hypothetical protein
MQVTVNPDFTLTLNRNRGGAIVKAVVDAWKSTGDDWELAGSFPLMDVATKIQKVDVHLEPGVTYLCMLRTEVEESLNGVFDYNLFVNNTKTVVGNGDVNTTGSAHDSAAFKAPFFVEVV